MAKPSRTNFDDSSNPTRLSSPRSAPPLSNALNGQGVGKQRQSLRVKPKATSTMSLLISGASILLVMLIIVAVLQQRAMQNNPQMAEAESTAPATTTDAQVDGVVTPNSEPNANASELVAESGLEVGSPSDDHNVTADSLTVTAADRVADPSTSPLASTEEVPTSEAMPAEEPEEITPEATDPTAADFESRIARAAQLIREKKGKEAIITLKQASGAYPKEIRADFYLGLIYSGLGLNEPKNAEIHFKRVLDRAPGHVATLNNLGLVAINAHKYPAARNYFSQALKAEPRPTEVDQNLGRMLSKAKVLEIKNDQVKMISALKPNANAHQSNVGWMYMPLDRSERSLQEYKDFSKFARLEDRSCCVCQGQGAVTCRTCAGRKTVVKTGTVAETKNLGLGAQSSSTPVNALVRCPECGGSGRVNCHSCNDGTDPSLGGVYGRK